VSLVVDTVVAGGQRYREMDRWLGSLRGTASRLLRESLLLVAVYFLLDVPGRPERALRVGFQLFLYYFVVCVRLAVLHGELVGVGEMLGLVFGLRFGHDVLRGLRTSVGMQQGVALQGLSAPLAVEVAVFVIFRRRSGRIASWWRQVARDRLILAE